MQFSGATTRSLLALSLGTALLAACGQEAAAPVTAGQGGSNTAVLGSYGSGPRAAASAADADAAGNTIPRPPLPPRTSAQLARSGPASSLAVWVRDGAVVSATYEASGGWSAPQPLEQIYGTASDAQLASNGKGAAIAVWRHRVGNILSLRFSRWDAGTGWSAPDVMPGALPRERPAAAAAGQHAQGAPRLEMDDAGNAFAEWPSGFAPDETQSARYVAGHGWTQAISEPVASAAPAQETSATR